MSTDTVPADPVARNIVNQLFDLLTEEISRRSDEPLQEYLLVDARQASNDQADQFVTKLLAAARHEHCGRIARWADKKAQQSRDRANYTDRMSQHKRDEAVGEARAYAACARLIRGDTDVPPP